MELRTYIENYIQQSAKKRNKLDLAAKVSVDEIISRVEDFTAKPNAQSLVILLRGLTTSGIYISRTLLEYLISHLQLKEQGLPVLSRAEVEILKSVQSKEKVDPHVAHSKDIFSAIFKDLLISHASPSYRPYVGVTKFKSTLVLVSGVLNEIFSTAAYERGAKHLSDKLGIQYICPKVYGTKSVEYNSKILFDQLNDYSSENPDEKFWILAFSKGGVDCLHFLADNQSFASEKIEGLSTISSPILGTSHQDHKMLKIINSLHRYSDSQVYQFFERQSDFLFKDFQNSLSRQFQKSWFSKNHQRLPKLNFYTALATQSSWSESHLWMILTKAFFQNKKINDGVVEAESALYPSYFNAENLGIVRGHHLIGTRSSSYNQEALLEAHVVFLQYLNFLQ